MDLLLYLLMSYFVRFIPHSFSTDQEYSITIEKKLPSLISHALLIITLLSSTFSIS